MRTIMGIQLNQNTVYVSRERAEDGTELSQCSENIPVYCTVFSWILYKYCINCAAISLLHTQKWTVGCSADSFIHM